MICLIGLICLQVISSPTAPLYDGAVARMPNVEGLVFLAHNSEAGRYFFRLGFGDLIAYQGETFAVDEFIFMQALFPTDPRGDLLDLESGIRLSARQVRGRVYADGLTLQTCVWRDDDPSWGRLFVRARRTP
jgi:hypothetical protein